MTVELGKVTELEWEIAPHACEYLVNGRIRTHEGDPVPNLIFVICPAMGSGDCPSAEADEQGNFTFLARYLGDVAIRPSHRQPGGGSCDVDSRFASEEIFTIRPTQEKPNQLDHPSDTCS